MAAREQSSSFGFQEGMASKVDMGPRVVMEVVDTAAVAMAMVDTGVDMVMMVMVVASDKIMGTATEVVQ
ncbi:hypothetical protein DPMN_017845 [Dreissena polymorpha]|uniref:Uncharacterized protein n=1 Tax=Dreissena polymorpha TaxID=45954 RepID=A0A9D4NG12_DREPO|nr:hypothetical protein DPMN_017845 [Dreissena polymorpha]